MATGNTLNNAVIHGVPPFTEEIPQEDQQTHVDPLLSQVNPLETNNTLAPKIVIPITAEDVELLTQMGLKEWPTRTSVSFSTPDRIMDGNKDPMNPATVLTQGPIMTLHSIYQGYENPTSPKLAAFLNIITEAGQRPDPKVYSQLLAELVYQLKQALPELPGLNDPDFNPEEILIKVMPQNWILGQQDVLDLAGQKSI